MQNISSKTDGILILKEPLNSLRREKTHNLLCKNMRVEHKLLDYIARSPLVSNSNALHKGALQSYSPRQAGAMMFSLYHLYVQKLILSSG